MDGRYTRGNYGVNWSRGLIGHSGMLPGRGRKWEGYFDGILRVGARQTS